MPAKVITFKPKTTPDKKISIIGGCGHVGLPLGITFALKGFDVTLVDINKTNVELVNDGKLPFLEEGGEEGLKKVIGKNLRAESAPSSIESADVVIFVVGTPVDEHLNPRVHDVISTIDQYYPLLNEEQLVVLRSTLYPGLTELVSKHLKRKGKPIGVAFCPERVAQGHAIEEIQDLPQIISAMDINSENRAAQLFRSITKEIIRLAPLEAELVKLFANTWRYVEFAIANQHYMIAESHGINFQRIYMALTHQYPRAKQFTKAGLTAGPCLFKDTMQLSSFCNNNYLLGHAAMLINEGLPNFLVNQLDEKVGGLAGKKVGLLGMGFKPNHDDIRESLSYKIKKGLEIKMAKVLDTDVYQDSHGKLQDILEKADCFILGVPHDEYKRLDLRGKPFIDCWGVWNSPRLNGEMIVVDRPESKAVQQEESPPELSVA